jgi:hypothetical protein
VTLTWTLWWIDVAISVACCMFLPFAMYALFVSKLSEAFHCWEHSLAATPMASAI